MRTATHRRQIILFDRFSQQLIVLADRPAGPPGNPSATPGEVNGDVAVAMHRDRLQRVGVRHRHGHDDAPAQHDARPRQPRPVR
ncbi:MAG TPA: hypothetical protein VN615_00875, partial [Gaiellales bacterium]|nr:hypothetical protein [Gaiellales bacterium]